MRDSGVTIHGLVVRVLFDHRFKIMTQFARLLQSYMYPLLRPSDTINHCICACVLLALKVQCNESLSAVRSGVELGRLKFMLQSAQICTDCISKWRH